MLSRFLLFVLVTAAHGQWVDYPVTGIPRTKDGKPDLTAPAPRINGKPDFTGIWLPEEAKPGEIEKVIPGISDLAVPGDDSGTFPLHAYDVTSAHAPGEIAMTLAGRRRMEEINALGDQGVYCLPMGLPLVDVFPSQKRFVQTGLLLIILYEGDLPRQIHMDGRPLPQDPQPAWTGYSSARWDEDTLVVETIGLNERAPLDYFGHPRSSEMRMTERIRRPDFGHMEIEVTLNDPAYYSKPVAFVYHQILTPDADFLEYSCTENEKDAVHLVK